MKEIEKYEEIIFGNIKHVDDHFAKVGKMVQIGSRAKRIQDDYKLSRYACYLVVQNSNTYSRYKFKRLKKSRIIYFK